MKFRIFSFIVSLAVIIVAIFIYPISRRSSENGINIDIKISTSTINLPTITVPATSTPAISLPAPKQSPPVLESITEIIEPNPKPVSAKSLEELINSSIIQLYCGYLNSENATFSDISRGTGVIISSKGEILTNRHIIYDENLKKARNDCFVLKSPFPNEKSQNPKIYYFTEIIGYPAVEKFSESFSKDKYYNDFAILKIISKISIESKLNLILGFDYASLRDYLIIENSTSTYNFLPIDWNYEPKDGDALITLGYGIDASRMANKITSTIGKLIGIWQRGERKRAKNPRAIGKAWCGKAGKPAGKRIKLWAEKAC